MKFTTHDCDEHEAKASKISEEQLITSWAWFCRESGAAEMIVMSLSEPFTRLPMEYAVGAAWLAYEMGSSRDKKP